MKKTIQDYHSLTRLLGLLLLVFFTLPVLSNTKYLYVGETYKMETPTPASSNGYIDKADIMSSADRLYVNADDPYNVTITVLDYFTNIVPVKVRFVEKYTVDGHIQKLDHDVEISIGAKKPTISIPSGYETVNIGLGEKGKLRFNITPSGLYAPQMNFIISLYDVPALKSDEEGNIIQEFHYDKDTGEGYLEITGSTHSGGTNHILCEIFREISKLMWTVNVKDDRPVISADVKAGTVDVGTKVTLTSDKSNTDIYYTLDGSTPSKNSTKYTQPIVINKSLTLKARGYIGDIEGRVMSRNYTIKQEKILLSATPSGGEINKGTIVYIKSSNVPNADIHYTLDGSRPTKNSTKYTSSGITINEACTLKAIAYKDGYDDSDVLTERYSLPQFSIKIDAINFPDENFRQFLLEQDYGKDGTLTGNELESITEIDLTGRDVSKKISSLQGIGLFTSLNYLDCSSNKLTSLDVSQNTALTFLRCSYNQLTSLNVLWNASLTYLDCSENQIKGEAMDDLINSLPNNSSSDKYILRVVLNPETDGNVCTKKQVAKILAKGWVPYCANFLPPYYINVWKEYEGSEPIAALIDETNFPDENFRKYLLEQDYGKDGVITDDELKRITWIDVRGSYNSPGNIVSLQGVELLTALTNIYCQYNQLTHLDVSKNKALLDLDCSCNQLTTLDVTRNTALTSLSCYSNQLSLLDVSQNKELKSLQCFDNMLTSLDLSQNTKLIILSCSGNQLKSLDVSQNWEITYLSCGGNLLTSLDVSNNKGLTSLGCGGNLLASLDISNNTALKELYCYRNNIKDSAMDDLINSLPLNTENEEFVFRVLAPGEGENNVCTTTQVAAAKAKGWTPYYFNSGWVEYEGSEPISEPEQTKKITFRVVVKNSTEEDVTITKGGFVLCDGTILVWWLNSDKTPITLPSDSIIIKYYSYKDEIEGQTFASSEQLEKWGFQSNIVFYDENGLLTTYLAKIKDPSLAIENNGSYGANIISNTTSINDSRYIDENRKALIFNLNGQRLDKPRKGINIIGGKKVFVK